MYPVSKASFSNRLSALWLSCKTAHLDVRQHLDTILWSDGKQETPMLTEFPAITRCRACRGFYWVDDAEIKGEIEFFMDESKYAPAEWKRAKPTKYFMINSNYSAQPSLRESVLCDRSNLQYGREMASLCYS